MVCICFSMSLDRPPVIVAMCGDCVWQVNGWIAVAKEFVMDLKHFKAGTAGAGVVEVHRSLTRTDLLFCLLPVAAFLSIVSLV